MRIEIINQWRDVIAFYRRFKSIHADFSIVFVNVEYSYDYKAVYFVLLGLGIEVILQEGNDVSF